MVYFATLSKSWDRPMLETKGYAIQSDEKGYYIIANVLGINQSDLKVVVERGILKLSGSTTEHLITYKVSYSWDLQNLPVKEISVKVKDGVAYITIPLKEEDAPKITVAYEK